METKIKATEVFWQVEKETNNDAYLTNISIETQLKDNSIERFFNFKYSCWNFKYMVLTFKMLLRYCCFSFVLSWIECNYDNLADTAVLSHWWYSATLSFHNKHLLKYAVLELHLYSIHLWDIPVLYYVCYCLPLLFILNWVLMKLIQNKNSPT